MEFYLNMETLKLNYEFKNVFDRGKYYIGNQIIVYVLKNKFDYNRIGIAISSKLCNAVSRNHIKRLIREAYRNNIGFQDINGYDIVIIWNKKEDFRNASYKVIYDDFYKILKKIGNIQVK